jgi:hypothetical protein
MSNLAERAKRSPLAAIRLKCLDCCAGQACVVRNCGVPSCALYPFRFGRGFRSAPSSAATPPAHAIGELESSGKGVGL